MSSRPKPRLIVIALALIVCVCAIALAQAAPDAPPPVSSAVVAIGVVALDPAADSSPASFTAARSVSIQGSGFFVSKQGHVITALHVVRATERAREAMQGTDNRLFVGLRSGSGFVAVPAEVVGTDDAHDLALLRIKLPGAIRSVVKLSSGRPPDGALIETAGLPGLAGAALVWNTGHLSDTILVQPGNLIAKAPAGINADAAQQSRWREFYLADLKADEGMSGGPVYLVESGAVIGVVHGYTHDPRLTVLVPARYVVELLKSNDVSYDLLPPASGE